MFVDEEELKEQLRRREQENQPPPRQPEPMSSDGIHGYNIVTVLSVSFAIFGAICFIVGLVYAAEHYDFNWVYFMSGAIAAMFNLGWDAVMRVCALYMRAHDK